jgi:hypothetical protein
MVNGGYVRRKPCRICRKFYRPHARVGDRQKTCGQESCRKAWRSRKNREAYQREREYHRGHALRKKIEQARPRAGPTNPEKKGPKRRRRNALQLPYEEIREALGVEASVVLSYLLTLNLRRERSFEFW